MPQGRQWPAPPHTLAANTADLLVAGVLAGAGWRSLALAGSAGPGGALEALANTESSPIKGRAGCAAAGLR